MRQARDPRRFSAKNKRKRADKTAKAWKQQKESKLPKVEEQRNYVAHELLCQRYRDIYDNDLRLTHHARERMAQRNISVQELFDCDVRTVVHGGTIVTTYRTPPRPPGDTKRRRQFGRGACCTKLN